MYDIQWFKVEKNIFYNRKIQLLLGLKDGDTYFRVWMKLLSLAVECGDGGRLIIGNNPISVKEFSKIMGKSSKKMSKILDKFLELEMLKKDDEVFVIKIGTSIKALIGKKFTKSIIVKDKDVLVKKRKKNRKKLTLV